jgi:hypothetical protein
MIKVFIPVNKGRVKSNIRGFWRSDYTRANGKSKTYYDYLKIEKLNFEKHYLQAEIFNIAELLKEKYNQECIAYKENNILKIYYSKDKIEILSHRLYSEVKPEVLRAEIKAALRVYGGITIYKEGKRYFKEIFYK